MKLPAPAREIAAVARQYRLSYDQFKKACFQVRRHLTLKPSTKSGNRLPRLLTPEQVTTLFNVVDRSDNLQHQLLFRLLLYTGLRVSELCSLTVGDVDLSQGKIYVSKGKGDKDRYVLFPERFGLTLKAYLRSRHAKPVEALFESQLKKGYSTRRVHQMVADYGKEAGIEGLHPHLFRHQNLTHLTTSGLSDSQIMLVSGHANKKTLEKYQHLSLGDVKLDYEAAMKKMEV